MNVGDGNVGGRDVWAWCFGRVVGGFPDGGLRW